MTTAEPPHWGGNDSASASQSREPPSSMTTKPITDASVGDDPSKSSATSMGAIAESDVSVVDSLPHATTKATRAIIPRSNFTGQFSNPLTGIATDLGPELVCRPGADRQETRKGSIVDPGCLRVRTYQSIEPSMSDALMGRLIDETSDTDRVRSNGTIRRRDPEEVLVGVALKVDGAARRRLAQIAVTHGFVERSL
jgi:hypothetical protein